jgi:hypothetical protein
VHPDAPDLGWDFEVDAARASRAAASASRWSDASAKETFTAGCKYEAARKAARSRITFTRARPDVKEESPDERRHESDRCGSPASL